MEPGKNTSEILTPHPRSVFFQLRMAADSDNPLLFDVLTGSSNSYTANPDQTTLTEVIHRLLTMNHHEVTSFSSIQPQWANERY